MALRAAPRGDGATAKPSTARPPCRAPQVTFGRNGDGHTAARHFVRQHLAQLRFQNPEAEVTQRNSKEAARSLVSLTLAGAEPLELDVTGLAHRTDVLRRVLEAVRVGEAELQAALVAAEAQSDVTIDSEGYDDKRPVKVHGVPPRVVNPLPTKRAHPVERE